MSTQSPPHGGSATVVVVVGAEVVVVIDRSGRAVELVVRSVAEVELASVPAPHDVNAVRASAAVRARAPLLRNVPVAEEVTVPLGGEFQRCGMLYDQSTIEKVLDRFSKLDVGDLAGLPPERITEVGQGDEVASVQAPVTEHVQDAFGGPHLVSSGSDPSKR